MVALPYPLDFLRERSASLAVVRSGSGFVISRSAVRIRSPAFPNLHEIDDLPPRPGAPKPGTALVCSQFVATAGTDSVRMATEGDG